MNITIAVTPAINNCFLSTYPLKTHKTIATPIIPPINVAIMMVGESDRGNLCMVFPAIQNNHVLALANFCN